MEILPVVAGRETRMVKRKEGNVITADREAEGETEREDKDARRGLSVPLVVAGLSWWMLLMTAAYFHTWFEKASQIIRELCVMAYNTLVHWSVCRFRRYRQRVLPSPSDSESERDYWHAGCVARMVHEDYSVQIQ